MDFNGFSTTKTNLKSINTQLAQLISTITSTFRYESNINASMDELITNLSYSRRLHHFMASSSYLNSHQNFSSYAKLMTYLFEPKNQLLSPNLSNGMFLNGCLVHVGEKPSEDEVNRSVEMQKKARLDSWIGAAKLSTGLCAQPAENLAGCLLTSSTAIKEYFAILNRKFDSLYAKKAFVHWYENEGMKNEVFKC